MNIELNMQSCSEAELLYCYAQSPQLNDQTGFLGTLRGDFGASDQEFWTTWFGWNESMCTDAFFAEINKIILILRERGLLKNREQMKKYVSDYPDCQFDGNFCTEYAFKISQGEYTFMLRGIPVKGDYNFYLNCYLTKRLNAHMMNAEKGIRFIHTDFTEQFRIKDGDRIKIVEANGETRVRRCRYLDEYHMEVGHESFHIRQFAEWAAFNGWEVTPKENIDER